MAPVPLTPISEESLPNFAEIKVKRERNNTSNKAPEDKGCLFFYDSPEVKGPFSDDTFFKDAQKNYEEAVQRVLNRTNTSSTPAGVSNMSTYRSLRQDNGRQETQASGLTEHSDKFQIVLDVHSYAPADITVKAVGDQELLLEGQRLEQRPDGTTVNQSFSRRFCLPGLVRLDAVTSALSSDGVLTVTAPKLDKADVTASKTGFIQPPPSAFSSSNGIQSSIFNEKEDMYNDELGNFLNEVDLETRMKYQLGFGNNSNNTTVSRDEKRKNSTSEMVEEDLHYKISLDTSGYSPKDISVKAIGERELLVEGEVQKNENGTETSQSFSRRFTLPGQVRLESVTSSLSPKGVLTIKAPKVVQQQSSINNVQNHYNHSKQASYKDSLCGDATSQHASSTVSSDHSTSFFSDPLDDFFSKDFGIAANNINHRNQDMFMEKARKDYKESMENMMNRNWRMECAAPTFFSNASSLSAMEKNSEQSSSDIIESANDYKMKLDVSKYRPEEVSVKAVGDRELLIEGRHVEKAAGGPALSHSFSRRFHLPGHVQLEAVTSALSADGVLTITAPKMTPVTQQ